MGFKLQDRIQQMRGIPGKYKRILTAIAQRARNDGTNFYESKDTIADKAGVSRWTAYRNIDDMVDLGALVAATSHVCSNPDCPKGAHHFFMAGNHWTEAINLILDVIFSLDTKWSSKMQHDSESSRVAKRRKCRVAKPQKSGVAKCDPIQGNNESRFSGTEDEPSALASGSKKASKQETAATPPIPSAPPTSSESENPSGFDGSLPNQDHKQHQPQHQESAVFTPPDGVEHEVGVDAGDQARQYQTLQDLVDSDDYFTEPVELLFKINPNVNDAMVRNQLPFCAQILEHFDYDPDYRVLAAEQVLKYNRAHRGHKYATKEDKKMYIRSAEQFFAALTSEKAVLMGDYDSHDPDQCELCINAGALNYKKHIRAIREEEQRIAAQKKRQAAEDAERKRKAEEEAIAAAARKAEQERLAKLCPKCQANDRCKHTMFVRSTWQKVCDACYDKQYEQEQAQLKLGMRPLPTYLKPRPGYLEDKAAAEAAEAAARQKAVEDAEEDVPICPECGRAGKTRAGHQQHMNSCPVIERAMEAAATTAK